MTVEQYIKILQDLPQDATVVSYSNNFEQPNTLVEAFPPIVMNYKKITRQFRDAFDRSIYYRDVYEYDEFKGEPCVKI